MRKILSVIPLLFSVLFFGGFSSTANEDNLASEIIVKVQQLDDIDDEAPDTVIINAPRAFNKMPATIRWNGSDNLTPVDELQYSWRLNGAAWSNWSNSTEIQFASLLETFPYLFEVRSRDNVGLIDESPAVASFTADFTPPSTTITLGPIDGSVAALPISYHWVGSDNITASTDLLFSYRLDFGIWSNWSTERTVTYYALTPGLHHIQVRACDTAGNIDANARYSRFYS